MFDVLKSRSFRYLVLYSILIGISIAIVTNVLYNRLYKHNLELIYNAQVIDSQSFIKNVIDVHQKPISTFVKDYTYWDDMVKFANGGGLDKEWAKSNIDYGLTTFKADFVIIYNSSLNKILHSHRINDGIKISMIDIQIKKTFKKINDLQNGVISIGTQHLLFYGMPIQTESDKSRRGSTFGYMISGILLDSNYTNEMRGIIGSKWDLSIQKKGHFSCNRDIEICTTVRLSNDLVLYSKKKNSIASELKHINGIYIIVILGSFFLTITGTILYTTYVFIIPMMKLTHQYKAEKKQKLWMISEVQELHSIIKKNEDLEQEKKIATVKLFQSSKLATLGQMIAGVAHEINNPLGIMIMKLDEFIMNSDEDNNCSKEEILKTIESVKNAAWRIARIVKTLRVFSRDPKSDPFVEEKFEDILDEVRDFCDQQFKLHNIKLELNIISGISFECKKTQIGQILLNLLVNARDAVQESQKKDKTIAISIYDQENDVVLSIEDNGIGISEENKKHIFEPFFTTKSTGKGTGLGLSITKELIKEHDGKLMVESKAGEFTKFIVIFPKKHQVSSSPS